MNFKAFIAMVPFPLYLVFALILSVSKDPMVAFIMTTNLAVSIGAMISFRWGIKHWKD